MLSWRQQDISLKAPEFDFYLPFEIIAMILETLEFPVENNYE